MSSIDADLRHSTTPAQPTPEKHAATDSSHGAVDGRGDPDSTLPAVPARLVEPEQKWTAWLCVAGSFLYLAPSYGFMQSVGTIQAYLSLNQLSDYSDRDIGWIPGLYTFLALFLGLQTGPLVDVYGPRVIGPLGLLTTVPMFFLLGECKLYWHFMLCLGVLGGIGAALSAYLAIAIVGKLFTRLRGLAMGIALAGSSAGGIIFPLMLRSALPAWGYQWSCRAMGFAVAGMMVVGMLCMLPFDGLMRGPDTSGVQEPRPADDSGEVPHEAPQPKRSASINFSAFKSPPFSFITGCMFLLEFAIFGITGMLPTIVVYSGFPQSAGYTMIAILNGASCLGRIIPGILGDHWGHYNILIAMTVLTLLGTAVTMLPFGTTYIEALYVFSGLWGFGSGSFLSLTPVCMGKTCEAKDYGRAYGTMNFVVSFGLIITVPIGGQMLSALGAAALSGLYLAILCLGGVSAFASRALLLGSWFDFKAII
ncbi:major facilitator superfamily domain-containing protein [Plectosphaerella plurivora]|uniref:Major facilitator superfamily domain-containing protein n=1 Tax=Plectosphaerella plurivora TaxID=936078 RepID=A0A9P8VJT7_9PEZI|nr:major facilitator superfamily domain-containing protein [Plectosphaerella plurivora]